MPKQLDPNAIAQKWAANTASPQANAAYKQGIQNVTENPMQKAAQKLDKYRQGVLDALDSGKTQAALLSVPMQTWQSNAIDIGAKRIADGVKKGQPKMNSFLQSFVPFLQQAMNKVNGMDDTTLESRIAKSAEMQRTLAQYKRPAVNRYS